MRWSRFRILVLFLIAPLAFTIPSLLGLLTTSGVYLYSGLAYESDQALLPGLPTIDPNYGVTSEALGLKAAKDIFSGELPLWNHHEGFGTPLLGEMQSAALFPFTWLQILPHGQVLELAVLQFIAGLGTFLFLRTAGLSRSASLTGGILFQFNGIFAWLRFAIFGPVTFLPLLMLSIELAYRSAGRDEPLRRRFLSVALGGTASALALYGGFPEAVYLYSFVLLLWTGLRFLGLKGTQARWIFMMDLTLVAVLGLLLSLPVLLAFIEFLPEAALGGHDGNGYYGTVQPIGSLLQYFVPYIYGTIDVTTTTALQSVWGATGGYIGVMPIILAAVALQLPERRVIKVALATWILVAIAVTFGVPGIYQGLMHLPLMAIAATFRYINAGWIFCAVILASICLDELARNDQATTRRVLLRGTACGCVAIVSATILSWSVLWQGFSEFERVRTFVVFSVAVLSFILVTVFAIARVKNRKVVIGALAVLTTVEAVLYFSIPYLSYPMTAKIDSDLVDFLKDNLGFQRVVTTEAGQFTANYGSYFGISQLNWNDVPSPRPSVRYVQQHLDPYVYGNIWYLPESVNLTAEQEIDRRSLFGQRLKEYAQAGVKYVLASSDPSAYSIAIVGRSWGYPVALNDGQQIEVAVPIARQDLVAGLSVLIGTYGRQSDGRLQLTVCHQNNCASNSIDLPSAMDNAPAAVRFDPPIELHQGDDVRITIKKVGGSRAVGVWTGPIAAGQTGVRITDGPSSVRAGSAPVLRFVSANSGRSRIVHHGKNTDVFELSNVRRYFDSIECTLTPETRDSVRADCPTAGRLVRLELALPGWRAFIGEKETAVRKVDDIFQEISLPEGRSTVRFIYAPAGVRPAVWISSSTLVIILSALAWCAFSRREDGPVTLEV